MAVLHVWAFLQSSPEACGHSALLYVCHIHMCEISQGQNRQKGTLYSGTSCLNINNYVTGEHYGLVVLEEGSAEAIFTCVTLQDKGLYAGIISQSGPEKHVANQGL